MAINRRQVLLGASAASLALVPGFSFAQGSEWVPTQDVEFVIPFGVGGGSDLLGRIVGKVIVEENLIPVPLVINNRPGGSGAVGIGYVSASRQADPHTLILVNGSTQIAPILNPKAKTLTEVQPIMNIMLDDFLLFVKGDSPYKTIQEFIDAVKAKPDKTFNFATGGTTDVMAIKVFSNAIGKEINPVNFNSGGEALTALLGGHVDGSIANPLEFMGHIKSGAVRPLAVFRETRFEAFPDVPTMKEAGFDTPAFQMWRGVAVPKGLEPAAVEYWTEIMKKVAASETMKKYIANNVATLAPIPGKEFEAFLEKQENLYRDLLDKPA